MNRIISLRIEAVRALAKFLDDRRVGKPGRRVLSDILLEQLDEVFSHDPAPDEDLRALFEQLHGVGYDQVLQEDLDDARSDMSAFFEAMGLDVEIPDLRPDMTEDELVAAAAEMADGMRRQEPQVVGEPPRRKTKRQLREEARAERQEQLRKIGLGAVYRRWSRHCIRTSSRTPRCASRRARSCSRSRRHTPPATSTRCCGSSSSASRANRMQSADPTKLFERTPQS